MEYKDRIIDALLEQKLEAFGAVWIRGPKGCGKTTSAKQKAKTIVEFQDEEVRDNLLMIGSISPKKLLIGEKPILFDEWQDAPKLWGTIRKNIDDTGETGAYILTGSSARNIDTPHTGTLRISQLKMYPMSLYESAESNGKVSLKELFDNPESFESCKSDMTIDDIVFALCRGGWPSCLTRKTDSARLAIAKDLFAQTYSVDISNVDGVRRNPMLARTILNSYSRNICTQATNTTIAGDIRANFDISDKTIGEYINALEELYIVEDIDAWSPAIRSKTVIRTSKKRNLIDPSIAVAAMGLTPEYFNNDFKTLGFLFESLCIRDLKIYSTAFDGNISFYRDRYDLEADAVLHLSDGRYALIEFKLGGNEIEIGARHLLDIERLIAEHNKRDNQSQLRLPDLKIIITAGQYGYRRDDGVLVIPLGALKD